jgi:hypothetical protein
VPKYVQVSSTHRLRRREDKKIDKRSGVSQRLPISCMENVIQTPNAAIHQEEKLAARTRRRRHACHHRQTGLEYEGEMKGADHVSRELIPGSRCQDSRRILKALTCSRSCNGSTLVENQLADTASAAALQSL